ncbi:hypothetical protein MP228_012131 [Amoeboaphelidium protococcarum]|nr:hypothetical protein MP228_012131 [Amoeboaphelidium protococcarum]
MPKQVHFSNIVKQHRFETNAEIQSEQSNLVSNKTAMENQDIINFLNNIITSQQQQIQGAQKHSDLLWDLIMQLMAKINHLEDEVSRLKKEAQGAQSPTSDTTGKMSLG